MAFACGCAIVTVMAGNRLLNLAYSVQKLAWRVLRPSTRGVKVMLFNDAGELLLIRNAYGRSDLYVLPGGGVRPFEELAAAATREVREELGVAITALELRSEHDSSAEGKRDRISLFAARVVGVPRPDRFEVTEARFVALDDLPAQTSPATRRRVAEYLGDRAVDGRW
jgi:8-oxo-dGTP pyrophosphatase MutT (NUDIX family)